VSAAHPNSPLAKGLLIEAIDSLANAERLRGQFDAAITLGHEEVAAGRTLAGMMPGEPKYKEALAMALKNLGQAMQDAKPNSRDGIPMLEESLALRKALYETNPKNEDFLQRHSEAHGWLSANYMKVRDLENAEKHARQGYLLSKELYAISPKGRANVATESNTLAIILQRRNKLEDALELQLESLKLRESMLADDPKSAIAALRVASIYDRVGTTYFLMSQHDKAIAFLQEALLRMRRLVKADPANINQQRELAFTLSDLAQAYVKANRLANVCPISMEALQVIEQPVKGLLPYLAKQKLIVSDYKSKYCAARSR
jgi:tetratricopeptide (TPR) repeat protein